MKNLLTLKKELMKLEADYKKHKKRIMAEYKIAAKYYANKKKTMMKNQKKTAKRIMYKR